MMIDGFGGFGVAAVLMTVVWLLFAGGLVVLVALAIRWLLRQERGDGGRAAGSATGAAKATPLDILSERYARGEIDDDEYERRRKLLTGG